MMTFDYKSEKNKNNICCCHDDDGGVFRVQGPYLIIEQIQKIRRKKGKKYQWQLSFIAMMIEGLCSGFRVYFQIWKLLKYSQKIRKKMGKIELVHTFVDNIGLMFSGSIVHFEIQKLIYFYPKKIARQSEKNRNDLQNIRYSFQGSLHISKKGNIIWYDQDIEKRMMVMSPSDKNEQKI